MDFIMKRHLIFFLFYGLISSNAAGQSPFSSEVDSLILRGIDLTFTSQFDSALATFQMVSDRHLGHLMGYFYQAATLQSKMMDYETDMWEEEFYRLIDKAIRLGNKQLEEGDTDAWTYFYLGSSHIYKGFYKAKNRRGIFSGIKNARKGLGYLKQAVQKDSTLYDAYMGIGNYQYWSSKYLRWLPWIRDARDEGVLLVILSVNRGTFSYWMGINSLAWIEYDRKRYAKALQHFLNGLEHYPGSRFFLWGTADTYYKMGIFDKAAEIYEGLLHSIQNGLLNNGFNEVMCRFKLVKTYFDHGQYEEALNHCMAIIDIEVEPKIAKRIKGRLKETKGFRKKCIEALRKRGVNEG